MLSTLRSLATAVLWKTGKLDRLDTTTRMAIDVDFSDRARIARGASELLRRVDQIAELRLIQILTSDEPRLLPQRQILALALDGPAMGRRRHAGSCQGLPSIEGLQASAGSSRCSRKARPTVAFRRGACSNRRGCVNFNAQRPLREFQQTVGHPPSRYPARPYARSVSPR